MLEDGKTNAKIRLKNDIVNNIGQVKLNETSNGSDQEHQEIQYFGRFFYDYAHKRSSYLQN